jgi:hypothetical protein
LHDDAITDVAFKTSMGLFATSSLDGTINMFMKRDHQIVRTFFHPKQAPIERLHICETPLPSVIGISNGLMFSNSLNGSFLTKITEPDGINSPIFVETRS